MEVSTERTTVRNFTAGDFADLFEYLSLPETYLFEPGEPISVEQAKTMALERSKGNSFFAVIYRPEGRVIGHFSFFQVGPEHVTAYELGYIFNPKYQGRGLATEAGRALIEYAFTEMKVHRIVANCNPEHQKSWRLAERLGLQREGVLKQNIYFREVDGMPKWLDTAVYGLVNHRERARS